ncbi:MAG: hypothetical protein ACKN85_15340, partial [Pirellula sp.]
FSSGATGPQSTTTVDGNISDWTTLPAGTYTITVQVLGPTGGNVSGKMQAAAFLDRLSPHLADAGQTILIPTPQADLLGVVREVFTPLNGTRDFARTLDTFTNTTGAPISTQVRVVGNLGSDSATNVFATSDGDLIVEPSDWWFGTDDSDGSGTPSIIHLLHGPYGLQPSNVNVIGDNVEWTYDLTIPAGATSRLVYFTVIGATRAESIAAANALVSINGFGGESAAFLVPEELGSLANFQFNTAPTNLSLSPLSIAENANSNANVGILSTSDDNLDDTFTYSLVSGTGSTDNAAFNINGSSLRANSSFDFETKSSYSVRIRSTDQGGLFTEKVFTISVTDVNETPTDISLTSSSIAENAGVNATVGTLSTSDPDAANTFTYSLVSGTGSTDNAAFNISGSSLRANSNFDFETKSSYSVRIRSTDQGGLFIEKVFTINATNTNELGSVTVNGADSYLNANQRSQVTSIVVVTESVLANPQSSFSLVNIGLLTASSTNLASSQILVTNVGNVYTIRFGAGTGVVSRAGTGTLGNSLADGNWILTVSGSEVTGSNQFGNRSVDNFFRMFGDSDGDGDVDGVDSIALRRAQLAATYNAALDWDGNGSVTSGVDINNFSTNLNKRRRSI